MRWNDFATRIGGTHSTGYGTKFYSERNRFTILLVYHTSHGVLFDHVRLLLTNISHMFGEFVKLALVILRIKTRKRHRVSKKIPSSF